MIRDEAHLREQVTESPVLYPTPRSGPRYLNLKRSILRELLPYSIGITTMEAGWLSAVNAFTEHSQLDDYAYIFPMLSYPRMLSSGEGEGAQ
jgi:hypothetical protein